MREAQTIQVKGIVQGVGFRPFVYRMAKKYLIDGWVLNATDGVFIHAEGESALLDQFVLELSENPPAASKVSEVSINEAVLEDFDSFEIRFSDAGEVEKTTLVSPDLATCVDCVQELFDPCDRRYRYPFINCTNCGPRFTIIDSLPYDRKNTSMKCFPLCSSCDAEYTDPLDRRFHAQPNACFDCGPHLTWKEHENGDISAPLSVAQVGNTRLASDRIIGRAVELLLEGKVVAVKGLGGFHLVCDGRNADALARLRQRKHREGKAFAVMMGSVDAVRSVCEVDKEEQEHLTSAQRPIVLLRKRTDITLAPGLADFLPELGVMLPYTPIQHLLIHDFEAAWATRGRQGEDKANEEKNYTSEATAPRASISFAKAPLCAITTPSAKAQAVSAPTLSIPSVGLPAATQCKSDLPPFLVMTSANIHDEPIVIDDEEAYEKLYALADGFMGHNRSIRSRYDDSVLRVLQAGSTGKATQFIRRARGFAPLPLNILSPSSSSDNSSSQNAVSYAPSTLPTASLFAGGSEQKNTFALTRGTEVFVSQHIGDMENAETFDAWLEAKARYETLFRLAPSGYVCDTHPEYLATKWISEQSRQTNAPLLAVQHHHAHIASVLGEAGLAGPVCGIAFDGTGFGSDASIWGGEVLIANTTAFERFANCALVPMPGGAAAIKDPLRMAYGVLWAFDLLDHPGTATLRNHLGNASSYYDQMIEDGINTPFTSSVGRLFDAASALLEVCTQPYYEGQPAILLEAAMNGGAAANALQVAHGEPRTSQVHEDKGFTGELQGVQATFDERYRITLIKNAANSTSTAQDTSVVVLDAQSTFKALLDDKLAGVPVWLISQRFHQAFVQAIVSIAQLVRHIYDINIVALSGGVFMNRYLIEQSLALLEDQGFIAVINHNLPPNDGCLSFGQAVVAWALSNKA